MRDAVRHTVRQSITLAIGAALVVSAAAQERRSTGQGTFEYIAGEPNISAVVRGAPYSGEGTTTIVQMLSDGTRIERTGVTRVYRDSDGRVRREQTVMGLGPLASAGDAPTVVTISDPVAGVAYVLDAETKQARRTQFGRLEVRRRMPEQADLAAPPPPPPPPPPPGARGRVSSMGRGVVPNVPQPLGTREVEGVSTVGTRRVETIPAGRIGNDRPIEITDERWESPELKVLVLSKHHDPRVGDTEYRLTGISRAEPPHHLFTVPSDYTVVDARDDRR